MIEIESGTVMSILLLLALLRYPYERYPNRFNDNLKKGGAVPKNDAVTRFPGP